MKGIVGKGLSKVKRAGTVHQDCNNADITVTVAVKSKHFISYIFEN